METLIARINKVLEEDKEIEEYFSKFENSDIMIEATKELEKIIHKLLRRQRAELVKIINEYVGKSDALTVAALFRTKILQWFDVDNFQESLSEEAESWFTSTISEISKKVMETIDKDIVFNQLSINTVEWVKGWSSNLGKLMKLKTHKAVEELFIDKLEKGTTIPKLIRDLRKLPEFDYNRARATAITETLTASSVADQESYIQSPAVIGKKWLHSGGKGIKPRPAHVALNGTVVGVEEYFDVNGYQALMPRDVSLPASERIYCHCTTVPVVDENILGLSADEKEAIRREVLGELGQEPGDDFYVEHEIKVPEEAPIIIPDPITEPEINPKKVKPKKDKSVDLSKYNYITEESKDIARDTKTINSFSIYNKKVIAGYTGSEYMEMNRLLRDPSYKAEEKVSSMNNKLQELISTKGKGLSEPTIMTRRFNDSGARHIFDDEVQSLWKEALEKGNESTELLQLQKKLGNAIISDKGFVSTSYKQDTFEKADGIELQVFLPKGYKNGLFVESVSENPGEGEYIMNADQNFKIVGVEVNDDSFKRLILKVVPTK